MEKSENWLPFRCQVTSYLHVICLEPEVVCILARCDSFVKADKEAEEKSALVRSRFCSNCSAPDLALLSSEGTTFSLRKTGNQTPSLV